MIKLRLSKAFFPTLREDVRDEDSTSGNLLVRAGYIKKVGAGIYTMLPLGQRICQKIENIIREEMDGIGSQELTMPVIVPSEVYASAGRLSNFGPSIFQLKDRYGKEYVLGPTHEELFTETCKQAVSSYKDLPLSLYQIQTKFRDEPRPRFGLIRVRQFVMKDSYTFARDLDGLDVQYMEMFAAYKRIFNRLGLDYVIVRADTGVMGGLLSEEFQALCGIGEDIIVYEPTSNYASNLEVAGCLAAVADNAICELAGAEQTVLSTPGTHTISELAANYNIAAKATIKTLIYEVKMADSETEKCVAVLVRGDREVNETKLQKLLHAQSLTLASEEKVRQYAHANIGSIGPFGLNLPLYLDQETLFMDNFVVGANIEESHLIHCNWRALVDVANLQEKVMQVLDLSSLCNFDLAKQQELLAKLPMSNGQATVADLRQIAEGDMCENGAGYVQFEHGIEVGNTFKLGHKYSQALNLTYIDENNERQLVEMGCYGIGVGRSLAAMVEQKHSENGLLWPKHLAPIQVAVVVVNSKNAEQMEIAEQIYAKLANKGIDIVLDDRKERVGVKFNDMELVGAYCRITVGRSISEGMVEIKLTGSDLQEEQMQVQLLPISEVETFVQQIFNF